MKFIRQILIPVLIVTSAVAAVASGSAIRGIFTPARPAAAARPNITFPVYDAGADSLFHELAALYNRIGELKAYLAEGTIRVTDQGDSSRNTDLRFRYCHKDSMDYYQLGDQEMLAVPGLYLSVNHTLKKIMMSPRPQAGQFKLLINEEQLSELKKEGYDITKENADPFTVIRLKREKHVSCREYRVTYDSTGFIRGIFMRNANEAVPEDFSKDRLISVQINPWRTEYLPAQLFRVNRYIVKNGDSWMPASAFRNYEIKYIY
ncbi:hypothetical protein ACFOTA_17760 [Chitinophaga sp. GCM10012297]|uniref:Outer membrane lipoprotein-sorting protein n=1 Tax=Chitinophaga chungangae TaxID=2821488 RepID=A0ABS3YHA0_9BACT|nr:hypothetical protein [Chitinophaga chungangae]MBO9154070.1 hypothetical protein [Chitinophaga chungangae]